MTLLLTMLRPLWPYLVGVLAVLAVLAYADHHGAARVQQRFDAYRAAQAAELKAVQDAWAKAQAQSEIATLRAQEHRSETFQPLRQRAHELPPDVRDIRVPAVAVGVSDAAIRAANAAGSTTEPAKAADPVAAAADDSTVGLLTDWITAAAEIHAECRDRVLQWQSFYRNLQQVSAVP
jgi:hypothetical protein